MKKILLYIFLVLIFFNLANAERVTLGFAGDSCLMFNENKNEFGKEFDDAFSSVILEVSSCILLAIKYFYILSFITSASGLNISVSLPFLIFFKIKGTNIINIIVLHMRYMHICVFSYYIYCMYTCNVIVIMK